MSGRPSHFLQFTNANLAALRLEIRRAVREDRPCQVAPILMQALHDRLVRAEDLNRQLAAQCEKFADRRLAKVFAGERR